MSGLNKEIRELHEKRDQAAPELARQARQKRGRKADGDIHRVDNSAHPSMKQQAADAHRVVRPPIKRWQRASTLAQLPAPPGYHIEWVRRDNQHRGDHANMIAHLREGWEFARKADFPDEDVLPTQRSADHGESIGNDSSVLMKISLDLYAQRNAHYNGKRDATTNAVNKPKPGLDVGHAAMPIVEDINRTETNLQDVRIRNRRRNVEAQLD